MGSILQTLKRVVPLGMKQSIVGSRAFRRLRAKRLARTSKRLDICAAQVAHVLHLAGGLSLAGKTCLEVGSGWVLSHAVVFHLLGAERVIATDIEAMAQFGLLGEAVGGSTVSLVRDVLSPFDDHAAIRERLERLLAVRRFSRAALERLGIEYVAPVDFARRPLGRPVDFVFSLSVLEHVTVDEVPLLLANLADDLSPGGAMIHAIHLEDHRDMVARPLAFLGEAGESYTPAVQGDRGNRIRACQWGEIFAAVPDTRHRLLYRWVRRDKPLPAAIDPSVKYVDEEDLRTSHLGVLIERL